MRKAVQSSSDLFREGRDPPDLACAVDELLQQIPAGKVTTYGDLADALGNRIASRWVGHYLLHHAHHVRCHCHRVVRADGSLGAYISGNAADKAERLLSEGVHVLENRVTAETVRYREFRSGRPLERLTAYQNQLRRAVSLRSPRLLPDLVGGVDVSYASPTEGVATYALVDRRDLRLVWSVTVRRPVRFPYISSYLAFRELPILLELIDQVRAADRLADVVLVDGSGILHPRRAGIASVLGVVAGLRTIGVTKKLLCGQVDSSQPVPETGRPIRLSDRVLGVALWPTTRGKTPLYVSPGHRANVGFAARVVADLLGCHKLPEPLYWADHLSRRTATVHRESSTAC